MRDPKDAVTSRSRPGSLTASRSTHTARDAFIRESNDSTERGTVKPLSMESPPQEAFRLATSALRSVKRHPTGVRSGVTVAAHLRRQCWNFSSPLAHLRQPNGF